jgi:hypothetical protein
MEFKGEEITGTHIVTGVFSFFTIALGKPHFSPSPPPRVR